MTATMIKVCMKGLSAAAVVATSAAARNCSYCHCGRRMKTSDTDIRRFQVRRRGFPLRRDIVMRCTFVLAAVLVNLLAMGGATHLGAQAAAAGHAPETPPPAAYPGVWRSQGSVTPCVLPWGGVIPCPPAAATVAIRAGRLF